MQVERELVLDADIQVQVWVLLTSDAAFRQSCHSTELVPDP